MCPDPMTLDFGENMVVERGCSRTRGSTCQVKCLEGRKASDPFITCEDDLEWHPKEVHCDIVCDRPAQPLYLMIDDSRPCNFHALEKCFVKCAGGRRLLGENFIYCQDSGTWSTIPLCDLSCPEPPPYLKIENETVCSRLNATNCTVGCETGDNLTFTNYCSKYGVWDETWPPKSFCGPYKGCKPDETHNIPICVYTTPAPPTTTEKPTTTTPEPTTTTPKPTTTMPKQATTTLKPATTTPKPTTTTPKPTTTTPKPTTTTPKPTTTTPKPTTTTPKPTTTTPKPTTTQPTTTAVPTTTSPYRCHHPMKAIEMYDCPAYNMMCFYKCRNDSLHIGNGLSRAFCDAGGDLTTYDVQCEQLADTTCDGTSLGVHIEKFKDPGPYRMLTFYEIECRPGYALEVGYSNKIVCEPGGNWGEIPKCAKACDMNDLSRFGLKVRTDKGTCWNVPGGFCPVSCLEPGKELERVISLSCRMDSRWASPREDCVEATPVRGFERRCGTLPDYLEVIPGSEEGDSPERLVRCKDRNNFIYGSEIVKCLKTDFFSKLPSCNNIRHLDQGENVRGLQCQFDNLSRRGKFQKHPDCLGSDKPGSLHPIGSFCMLEDPTLCDKPIPMLCLKNLEWTKPQCWPGQFYPKSRYSSG